MPRIPVGSNVVFTGNWGERMYRGARDKANTFKQGVVLEDDGTVLPYFVEFPDGGSEWYYPEEIELMKEEKVIENSKKTLDKYLGTPGFYWCESNDSLIIVTDEKNAAFLTSNRRTEQVNNPETWNVIPVEVKSLNVVFNSTREIKV